MQQKKPPCPWQRGAFARFHSPVSLIEPVSRLRRRALPLPLPGAPSRRLDMGRLAAGGRPSLSACAAGTLPVLGGFTTQYHYITKASPLCQAAFWRFFQKSIPRGSLRNLQSVDCPPPLFPSLSPGGGDKGGGFWREPQAKSAALPENHPFAEIRPSRIPLQFILHSVGRNKKITYSLLDSFPARSLL